MPTMERLRIRVLNLKNGGPNFSSRLQNIAIRVAGQDVSEGLSSDVFGLSECRHSDRTGPTLNQYEKPIRVPCDGEMKFSPECFGHTWSSHLSTPVGFAARQFGELGIVGNGGRFDVEGDFKKAPIGKEGGLFNGPALLTLGVRLRHSDSGAVLPFFVTHLRGDQKKANCQKMLKAVREFREPSDLPPVIVGDFNVNAGDSTPAMNFMKTQFDEMGLQHGTNLYDQCWVGRIGEFDEARYDLTLRDFFYDGGCNDGALQFTDHACLRVDLDVRPVGQAQYRVEVKTGNRLSAGTDSDVFLTLNGTQRRSKEFTLNTRGDNFERGKTDVFTISTIDVGALESVRIRHNNRNNKPGWFLDRIDVTDVTKGTRYRCACNRWLARNEDDGSIDRTLTAATM